eukprot:m.133858 g.133858  ORF g.133858 m.133858 type:complete len:71 (+) comp9494_c3_seq4:713-925(+)
MGFHKRFHLGQQLLQSINYIYFGETPTSLLQRCSSPIACARPFLSLALHRYELGEAAGKFEGTTRLNDNA